MSSRPKRSSQHCFMVDLFPSSIFENAKSLAPANKRAHLAPAPAAASTSTASSRAPSSFAPIDFDVDVDLGHGDDDARHSASSSSSSSSSLSSSSSSSAAAAAAAAVFAASHAASSSSSSSSVFDAAPDLQFADLFANVAPAHQADSDDDLDADVAQQVDNAPLADAPNGANAAPAPAPPAPALVPSAAIGRIIQLFSSRMLSKPNFTGTAANLQQQLGATPVDAAFAAFQSNLPVVLALTISTWLHTNVISFASVSRLLCIISSLLSLLNLAFPRTVDTLLELFSFATHAGPCTLSLDGERAMQIYYLVLCRGCNSNAALLGDCLRRRANGPGIAPSIVTEACQYQQFLQHRMDKFNAKCNTPWLSHHPHNTSLVAKADQRVWVLGTMRVARCPLLFFLSFFLCLYLSSSMFFFPAFWPPASIIRHLFLAFTARTSQAS